MIVYRCLLGVVIVGSAFSCMRSVEAATIQIRVINAKNGKGVNAQTVGVAIKGEKSQAQYVTDDVGNISVEVDPSAEIYVRTDWWITCHTLNPTAVPFVSVERILKEGFVDENTCGHAKSEPLRGKLIIFARKPTWAELLAR